MLQSMTAACAEHVAAHISPSLMLCIDARRCIGISSYYDVFGGRPTQPTFVGVCLMCFIITAPVSVDNHLLLCSARGNTALAYAQDLQTSKWAVC